MFIKDLFSQSLSSVSARPSRTILTLLGTILGVASFVAIIGLGATASGQISKDFNELQATHITVTDIATKNGTGPGYNFPKDDSSIIEKLNGAISAGVYYTQDPPQQGNQDDSDWYISRQAQAFNTKNENFGLGVFVSETGAINASDASFSSGVNLDPELCKKNAKIAVLGSVAAKKLGIISVQDSPVVFLGNIPFTVVGILNKIDETIPQFNTSVIIPIQIAQKLYGLPSNQNPATQIIKTKLGAGKLLSIQAPFALRPDNPDLLQGNSPPDFGKITKSASNSINSLLLVLSFISLVIGGVAIANTTLVSIMERRGEIGLRQALGAKTINIYMQILCESTILGTIGATIGNAIGIFSVLIGSILNKWTPIIDPKILLLAPFVGVLLGILSGFYPAYSATKINPAQALS